MTASWMGAPVVMLNRPCGRTTTIHRTPDLCTPDVHPSYTERERAPPATTGLMHMIHKPYDNDETWIDGIQPRVPGDGTTP